MKAKTGWKGERLRHSNAAKHGRAGGVYHMSSKAKGFVKDKIKHGDLPLTHPRKVGNIKGLFSINL